MCPVCHRSASDPVKLPFCSERCRRIDFFRWWEGKYAIEEVIGEDLSQPLDNERGGDNFDDELF